MERLLELAKEAKLKGKSETALSPHELQFAMSLIRECAQFTDTNTRKFMLKHFGVEE